MTPSSEAAVEDDADRPVRIPERIATRLRALDRDLSTLGARTQSGVVEGLLSMAAGGGTIALGALVSAPSEGFRTYLYIYGGATATNGLVHLILAPNPNDDAIAFAHMPQGTVTEVRARLRFGEDRLEALADRTRMVRILDGTIQIASGLAFIPLYLGPNDFRFSNAFDYIVLVGAAVSTLTGVFTLFSPTDAERRWDAYVEMRSRLRREREEQRNRDDARETARFDDDRRIEVTGFVAPVPNGVTIAFAGRF